MRYSMVPRLSSIGWQAARAAASSFCSAASSTLLPISAAAASAHQQRARRHRAERHARGRARAAGIERQAHAAADHGDVHLRARDEAQVGVARARRPGRQQERGDDLALGQRQLARRQHDVLDRHARAGPWGRRSTAFAPAAISAGTLSAAGEPLHRLPPMVARPWIWVEPIRLAASTTPGHTALSLACSLSSAPVTAAPTRKPPPSSLIWRSLGDALDVDHQHRLDQVGAHLHQQIGAAGQHARLARLRGEQRDRLVERTRRLITHMAFLLTGCAPAAWHSQPPSANPAAKMLDIVEVPHPSLHQPKRRLGSVAMETTGRGLGWPEPG